MKIAKYWLALAVTALGVSGLFTILLIVGRTSNALKELLAEEFFKPSLIVHVNLSVLVWLLAMSVAYFNYSKTRHFLSPLLAAAVGTALIIISPFTGYGEPYTNNYIPIFDNIYFKAGIAFFLGAVAFETITTLLSAASLRAKTLAALLFMSFACYVASYQGIADKTSSHVLYEFLFWGGGHVMQFAYVQVMLIAWLALADKAGINIPAASERVLIFIFALPVIFVAVSTPIIYINTKVESAEHIQMFTQQMIYGTGIAAILLGVLIVAGIIRNFRFNLYSVTLILSILLFAVGGALGNLAAQAVARGEITTVIPAHYHFSTIAVTVALMGYVFIQLGVQKTKLATWQISLYSIGQAIYFTGMAIFGGHGAARKTPGVDMIDMDEKTIKMVTHIMHSGGSLSLIGGILFVVIVWKSWKPKTA